ncbi:DEAD-box ATP-dependent RNA helicase 22-like isoform X2 [Prosopis cineraria]|uniref:DEAD-box ATP-dependent RNA helicase 22-like isoform X2 n=1 Tax=Prosopis cineraria TaxID=364024 RepID=UPI0024106653|nr:DEAD-box ATP-dependent RNA helicase 22-like isoform X2 [Prosopis cineraria]XP_054808191.1 DEAD-box ATP-dependent RNA helicase 22-like isoform X2 [Prosopis cineraria]
MIIYRSALMLHLQIPSIRSHVFSHFKHTYFFRFTSSPSLVNVPFISLSRPRQRLFKAFGSAIVAAANTKRIDTFLAEEDVSWNSLRLSDAISRALSSIGLDRPSLVQASSIPSVLSGKDVVIAAETGSGKTHSYLVPLIDKLRGSHYNSANAVSYQKEPLCKILLVLCPNVQLCEQVAQMANSICGDDGTPMVSVAAICGRQGWPIHEPDIIVTTPVALLNYVEQNRNRRMEFMRSVKYVVFDEADMLLCGSFQNKVIRLINLLRFDEKLLSQLKEPVSGLPLELESTLSSHSDSAIYGEQKQPTEDTISEDGNVDIDTHMVDTNNKAGSIKRRDWRRVRKNYEHSKQYLFVAATLPVNGKKTAGAILKHMFPDAEWVSGNYLHCHNPRLEQRWVEVTVDTQVDELIKAVRQGFSQDLDGFGGISRTMVFANTVEAVEAVAKILVRSGIECLRYHKDRTLDERAKALVEFREKGGVLVCTDAAARGVDIPNVSHVIQADFASSAVDFLHRIGRTGRAGQFGLVTSMYTESNRELVDAVRRAGELGRPVFCRREHLVEKEVSVTRSRRGRQT